LKLKQRTEKQTTPLAQEIAASSAEIAGLKATNEKLREENMDLKDEVEVLKATIEVLKNRQGLNPSSPRSSPIIPSFNPVS
jgi:cell division protein FtsB